VWSVDQFYQSLYRPDLVREKLAGDPRGLVREAAARLDLNKVVASGSAPTVTLLAPKDRARTAGEQVTAEIEIADRGGGIGRIEWRVNGVTVGVDDRSRSASVATPPGTRTTSPAKLMRVTRDLPLDASENEIEVVVYNRANLVASLPTRASVFGAAPAAASAPRLFVLTVGVNDYSDEKLKLVYAVPDPRDSMRK
jgi:hypothetical protein